jgi:Zn-finger nucleic acid-binding protein
MADQQSRREALDQLAAETERLGLYPDLCPNCAVDMDGGPIPDAMREHYAPPYRWSRAISIYDRDKDAHARWRCPDCQHEWK